MLLVFTRRKSLPQTEQVLQRSTKCGHRGQRSGGRTAPSQELQVCRGAVRLPGTWVHRASRGGARALVLPRVVVPMLQGTAEGELWGEEELYI